MKYTLYKVDNSKRSSVKGYWLDNGKVYRDNIKQVKYSRIDKLNEGIQTLFVKGEKAVFFTIGGQGRVLSRGGQGKVLSYKRVFKRSRLSGQEIRPLLSQYEGLTIYDKKRSKGFYFIEIYNNVKIYKS